MKMIVDYTCRHYFGQIPIEAETVAEAEEKAKQHCYSTHPSRHDSSPKVRVECKVKCKLKVICRRPPNPQPTQGKPTKTK